MQKDTLTSEVAAVGTLLADTDGSLIAKAIDIVKPEHFNVPEHFAIVKYIFECFANGEQHDLFSAAQKINNNTSYVMQLLETSTNVFDEIKHIKEVCANGKARIFCNVLKSNIAKLEEGIPLENVVMSITQDGNDIITNTEDKRGKDILQKISDQVNNGEYGKKISTSTGFKSFDYLIGDGVWKGSLNLIAARPSMGKTTLALNVARHMVASGKNCLFFSLEMTAKQIYNNIIAAEAKTNEFDKNYSDFLRACGNLQGYQGDIWFCDKTVTPVEIRAKATKMKATQNIAAIFIDYVQLMGSETPTQNRVQELAIISRLIKRIAVDLDIPVFLLSQLNRDVEKRDNKRPTMADLRESGALEQDADTITFLYRDEYYNPQSPDINICELILRKNRLGKTGTTKLFFNKEFYRFDEISKYNFQ